MRPSTNKYRGVTWHSANKKWVAKTRANGKYITFGYYDSPVDAARVFDCASKIIRGPNAILNFDGLPPPNMVTAQIRAMLRKRGLIRA